MSIRFADTLSKAFALPVRFRGECLGLFPSLKTLQQIVDRIFAIGRKPQCLLSNPDGPVLGTPENQTHQFIFHFFGASREEFLHRFDCRFPHGVVHSLTDMTCQTKSELLGRYMVGRITLEHSIRLFFRHFILLDPHALKRDAAFHHVPLRFAVPFQFVERKGFDVFIALVYWNLHRQQAFVYFVAG